EEAGASALGHGVEGRGGVARLGLQVHRAAQRGSAVAQGVGALLDLYVLRRQQLQALEVGQAVGVAVGHAVHQQVHAPQVEVVAQSRAADRSEEHTSELQS